MTLNTNNTQAEVETPSVLEEFKENKDAPFETVKKGEIAPDYPYAFFNKIRANWSKVCELMNWKKGEAPLDWNFFRVAKDPLALVSMIQEKILTNGGELPRFGVDGKFGSETEAGLNDAISGKGEVPKLGRGLISAELEKGEKIEQSSEQRQIKDKLQEMYDVLPKVEERLKTADLLPDKEFFEDPDFGDHDVLEFQTRAMKFREDLISQEPRLKPLVKLANKIVPIIEAEIKKIDLSKINSKADLYKVFEKMGPALKPQIDSLIDGMSEAEMEKLMLEVDMEVLMSFFMSTISELVVVMADYFKDNKENLQRLLEHFQDELLLLQGNKTETAKLDQNLNLPAEWNDLVKKGEITSGSLEFTREGKPVVLNIDDLTLKVGDKTGKLTLPYGAELDSVEATSDGNLTLTASLYGSYNCKILSPTQLNSYIDKVATAPTGEKIDLGSGAYIQV